MSSILHAIDVYNKYVHVYVLLDILYTYVQDDNKVERTFGDSSVRKRYSHIDLLHMIDGVEMQKATVAAGNRCYYMKV